MDDVVIYLTDARVTAVALVLRTGRYRSAEATHKPMCP
jgi:hypothetical protein